MSRDSFWGKTGFLLFFNESFRILSGFVWAFEKITLMVGKTFFHVSRGLSERKIFHHYFLKKLFGLWEKSFQTFGVLWIGRAFTRSIFFCQRKRDNFFQVNEITIKIFWPPTVSFLEFRPKSLAGFLESNYSCPEDFSAKKLLFHKNS